MPVNSWPGVANWRGPAEPCGVDSSTEDQPNIFPRELELELIQPHMAQKPVPRGEVGCACAAREVNVERGGMGDRGCARRLDGWVWV